MCVSLTISMQVCIYLRYFLSIFYADDKFIYFYHSIRWNKKIKAVCVTSSHTFRDSGIYCTKISATAGSSSSVTNRKFFPSGAISISGTNIVTIVSCYVTKAHINIGIEQNVALCNMIRTTDRMHEVPNENRSQRCRHNNFESVTKGMQLVSLNRFYLT